MKKIAKVPALLAVLGAVSLLPGCATQRGLERAAMNAADQIAALKIEVQEKVHAENAFYDDNLAEMKRAVADSRSLRLRRRIAGDASQFVEDFAGGEITAQNLVALAQGTVNEWKSTEGELAAALKGATDALETGRQDLRSDLSRLDGLQSQLRALGQARNKKQLAGFVYGFVSASADEYLQLRSEQAAGGGE